MRKILFRGKSYTDNKWHYGYYFYRLATPFSKERHEITDGAGQGWNCPIETVGQYTGLKDKNGKEIFEGDIVRHADGRIGYIVFFTQTMSYRLVLPKTDIAIGHRRMGGGYTDASMLEVIGNIHDNPDY